MPAPTTDPDAELMRLVVKGDIAAFEALVERYKQPVMGLVCRTLPDPTEAEDLAQQVFVQVYKAAPRYRAEAKFSTWLFTIARNLCLNEIRRRSRHPAESLDQSEEAGEEHPGRQIADARQLPASDELVRQELFNKVEEALSELPENQRTAILLFKEKQMAYEDIAKILGCSLSATKSLIHRGREALKTRLKPYLRTGEWGEQE